jgi:hypothetical protein
MKSRRMLILISWLFVVLAVSSPAIGVSTAVFIPRNGSLSHPVSPLSIRDLGFTIGKYVGLSGSISLYNINGMGLAAADRSAIAILGPAGPFYTGLGSIALKAIIPLGPVILEPAGGVFGYYLINPALQGSAIDSYIAQTSGHVTVDSSFAVDRRWGWGYQLGGTLTVKINDQIGIQAGALYYSGSSALNLSGFYRADGLSAELAVPDYLQGALLDFTGLEIILGVTYEM